MKQEWISCPRWQTANPISRTGLTMPRTHVPALALFSKASWVRGVEEEAGTKCLKDQGEFLALQGVTIHQQKACHGKDHAASPPAASPATAVLLPAMARHCTGHHGWLDPDCVRKSHLVPGGQTAHNQSGWCGGVPSAGRYVTLAPRWTTGKPVPPGPGTPSPPSSSGIR